MIAFSGSLHYSEKSVFVEGTFFREKFIWTDKIYNKLLCSSIQAYWLFEVYIDEKDNN